MQKNRNTFLILGALVLVFGASATFGFGLLINKNVKKTTGESSAATAAPTIPSTSYSIPSGAIFMATTGNDSNNGSQSSPVKSMSKALSIAPSGGTIVVRGGVYRDGLAGVSKSLTWQAYPGEQVWFDGTDVVGGWQPSGNTWYIDGWYTPEFCKGEYYNYAYNAQRSDNTGPCNHYDMTGDPSNPMAGSPQMAFVNGVALKEVTNLASVTSGTFYYDKSSRRFTIGTSPVGATVELARRPTALILAATSSIKGLGFRKYASNEYNNSTEAPVILSAPNSLIENSVFWANAGYGAGVSNSQGAVIRSSSFISNGFNGFTANGHHAGSTVDNILIEGNNFDGNNTEKFGTGCSASCAQAGIKLSHMNGGSIKNNIFQNNNGHGFWCDLYCTNFVITGNIARNNVRSGIFYEVSDKAIIASNLISSGGEFGLRIGGPNIKVYNNTVLSSTRMGLWVYDDPRVPSGSEVAGDTANVEVVNNIFQSGTDFLANFQGNQTTAAQLISTVDYNSYFRPTGTPVVGFKFGSSASGYAYYNTVAAFRTATGKEAHGQDITNQANPYFINASTGDYRIRTDSVAYRSGQALPADVASAIGVTAGQAVDRGALNWVGKPGGATTPPPAPTDTSAPVTAISSPTANASAKGTVTVSGSATDNVAVVKVDLLVDGSFKATDSTAPFASFSWDSSTVGDGAHNLSFKAYDAAGNTAVSPNVPITVSNVAPPPLPVIQSVAASPATVTAGQSSLISWSTLNASSCDVTPNGAVGTTAKSWQTPALTTVGVKTYTLICYNTAVQSVSKTVDVTVVAAPTPPTKPTFTADKTTVQSGGSVTFSWSSAGATSCVFNPGNIGGAATVSGKVVSNITANTTYTLTCQNAAGSTQATPITVTVTAVPVPAANPVITQFVADKSNVGYSQSTMLRWSTTGVIASGCRLNPGTEQDANGAVTTGDLIASTSYTLTCKNADGKTVSASTSVTVAGKPAPVNPTPITPTVDPDVATSQTVTSAQTGDKVANASASEQVSGLASLDISNVVDAEKEKAISYVEYYDGEKLIQKVTQAPFALDTKLLKNGSYSITERTYYIDGSQSEVTKVLGVANVAGAAAKKSDSFNILPVVFVLVLLLGILGIGLWFTQSLWMPVLEQKAPLLAEKLHARKVAKQPTVPRNDVDTAVVIRPDKKDK